MTLTYLRLVRALHGNLNAYSKRLAAHTNHWHNWADRMLKEMGK